MKTLNNSNTGFQYLLYGNFYYRKGYDRGTLSTYLTDGSYFYFQAIIKDEKFRSIKNYLDMQ